MTATENTAECTRPVRYIDIKKRNRVSVLKPNIDESTDPALRFTTVYIRESDYEELLAIAGGNRDAVAGAFRLASQRLKPREGTPWSGTCLAGARSLLKQARKAADAAAKAAASANNEAWERV